MQRVVEMSKEEAISLAAIVVFAAAAAAAYAVVAFKTSILNGSHNILNGFVDILSTLGG